MGINTRYAPSKSGECDGYVKGREYNCSHCEDYFVSIDHMASQLLRKPPATQQKPLLDRSDRYELSKAIADLTINLHFLLTPSNLPATLR